MSGIQAHTSASEARGVLSSLPKPHMFATSLIEAFTRDNTGTKNKECLHHRTPPFAAETWGVCEVVYDGL